MSKDFIVSIVRTLNEENNIVRFCTSYSDVDKILIADGGSTDRTKELASKFDNVSIRDFPERVMLNNGYFHNPEAEHINFLIGWANEYNPDWIIFSDCDCVPNKLLRTEIREILKSRDLDIVFVAPIFIYGDCYKGYWFPLLSNPNNIPDHWETLLWAWRPKSRIFAVRPNGTDIVHYEFRCADGIISNNKIHNIYPPKCILHFDWGSDEIVERKITRYRKSGLIPNQKYPKEFGGRLEKLLDYMEI